MWCNEIPKNINRFCQSEGKCSTVEQLKVRRPCSSRFLDTGVKIAALLVLHFTNPPNGSYYVTEAHHVLNYSTFGFSGHQYERCRLSQQMQMTAMSPSLLDYFILPSSSLFSVSVFIEMNLFFKMVLMYLFHTGRLWGDSEFGKWHQNQSETQAGKRKWDPSTRPLLQVIQNDRT